MTSYKDGTSLADASAKSAKQEQDKKIEENKYSEEEPRTKLKDEAEEYFKLFDDNGDGIINPLELHRAMKFLRKEVTMSDVIEIIQEVDNEGVGGVKFDKFEAVMREVIRGNTSEDDLRNVFDFLDFDRDGFVSTLDVQIVYRELGEMITPDEALFIMRKCDPNDDGLFDFTEFVNYCQIFIEDYQKETVLEEVFEGEEEEETENPQPFFGGFG